MDEAPFFPDVAEGPTDARAYWVRTDDDVRLRVAHWATKGVSRGTVFILPGRTENIEKYGRAVSELNKEHYDAFAVDWRGQGLSDRLTDDRMMGHINHYLDYQNDIAAMLKAAETIGLPEPRFLFGHSLGACIGLRALIGGISISACAFSAPLWDINLPRFQKAAVWPLSWVAQQIGRSKTYAPGTKGESYVLTNAFDENRLTHDPDMYRYYQTVSESLVDQQIGGPSMGWLYQTLKETHSLSKLPSPEVSCITFCGAEDTIVAIPAVQERMARWPNGKFNLVANGRHDLLYEVPRIRTSVFTEVFKLFSGIDGLERNSGPTR